MTSRRHHFLIPLTIAVLSTIVVLIGLINYWFGAPREEVMWFCERARDSFIKQPANTWSNLGFIIAGLYVGWLSWKRKFADHNLMTATSLYPVLFASVLVFLGPGSMAMHGSDGPWGGFLDLLSMFGISTFIFTYSLRRLFRFSDALFLILFTVMVSVSAYIYTTPYNQTGFFLNVSEFIFGGQILLGVPMEFYIRHKHQTRSVTSRGVMAFGTLGIAFAIWSISLSSDSWFCNPDSLIQGHAIWHILNALAAYFLFMFYVTENDTTVIRPEGP